jgi:hypothetical protein
MGLTPILVASAGRTGTTALMARLGTDPRVAFDRVYPFENRYLTYLAKFAGLAARDGAGPPAGQEWLYEHNDGNVGFLPWVTTAAPGGTAPLTLSSTRWLSALWDTFSTAARERHPGATHYAEKVPPWLPAVVREVMPCPTLYLVRDPRDVFLSVNAFNRARGRHDFGRGPSDSDLDHARTLSHGLLGYFENQRADRDRADSQTVRYEDLIGGEKRTVDRLNRSLGLALTCEPVGGDYLSKHQTSARLDTSIGRWKHESLPAEVGAFLETHLHEMLAFNGYELSAGARPTATIDLSQLSAVSEHGSLAPAAGGGWTATVTGEDFWLQLPPAEFPAAEVREVWLCVRANTGQMCSLYWRPPHEGFSEHRSLHLPCRPGGHWQVIRFRPAERPLWDGTIAQLRLDLFNGSVTPGYGGDVRWVRLIG